jgi:hypothetical protein
MCAQVTLTKTGLSAVRTFSSLGINLHQFRSHPILLWAGNFLSLSFRCCSGVVPLNQSILTLSLARSINPLTFCPQPSYRVSLRTLWTEFWVDRSCGDSRPSGSIWRGIKVASVVGQLINNCLPLSSSSLLRCKSSL